MATVTKRGKKWTAIYTDRTGKQVWKTGFSDKAETLRLALKLEDEERKVRTGMIDPAEVHQKAERRKAVEDHLDAYAAHLQAGGRSDNHLAYTLADIRAFITHSGAQTLSGITKSQIDEWVISLVSADEDYRAWVDAGSKGEQTGSPNSARTINRRVGSVQAILKWAHAAGAVGSYVLAKYPKREVRGNTIRESRPLSDEEVKSLLAWCQVNAPDRHNLYQFALLTGCRAEECAAMTPANFDLQHGTVSVHSKDPRHSDRVDVVPLHPEIQTLITELIKGKPADARIFQLPRMQAEQLRTDCQAAGIDPKDVTFHGLRHTFVTRLARRNVHPTITQKLARHRDISMTLGFYTHWSTNDERTALALL